MQVRAFAAGALAIAALAAPAAAQESVDVRRATSATGPLEVHLMAGEVKLIGWGRNEVHVTGRLARGTDRLEVSPQGDRLVIRVHQTRGQHNRSSGSELEIHYPARKTLHINTVSADVEVENPTGGVQAHTVSGNVSVDGNPATLEVHSRNGDIQLDGSTSRLTANTISGNVQVDGGVRGEVEAHTVSGDIQLEGGVNSLKAQSVSGSIQVDRVAAGAEVTTVSGSIRVFGGILGGEFNTVSGNIQLTGNLGGGRALEVHSHSGELELELPSRVNASLEITTWSGEIAVEISGAQLMQSSRRERQLRLGRGGPRVELSTFSGSVRVVEQ